MIDDIDAIMICCNSDRICDAIAKQPRLNVYLSVFLKNFTQTLMAIVLRYVDVSPMY